MTSDATIPATPRARFREMMRDDILAAARQIMKQGGYPALSMRALAEAVGVRAPTLYDYFASKDDVLNAIFMQGVALFAAGFDGMVESTRPGVDRLLHLGVSYRRFGLENPDLYQLLFARLDQAYIPGVEQIEAAHQLFVGLTAHVADAIAVGELEAADPEMVAMTLWSITHGYVSLELVGHVDKCGTEPSTESRYLFVIKSLFYGLAARDDSGAPVAMFADGDPAMSQATT